MPGRTARDRETQVGRHPFFCRRGTHCLCRPTSDRDSRTSHANPFSRGFDRSGSFAGSHSQSHRCADADSFPDAYEHSTANADAVANSYAGPNPHAIAKADAYPAANPYAHAAANADTYAHAHADAHPNAHADPVLRDRSRLPLPVDR